MEESLTNTPTLLLNIELVPEPLWDINLRKYLPKSRWAKIRQEEIKRRGKHCQICGKDCSKPRALQVHEHWIYSTNEHCGLSHLSGLQLSCWHCHMSEHWGALLRLSTQLPNAVPDTEAHFCKVNHVDMKFLSQHKDEAFRVWRHRSEMDWTVDWGDFVSVLLEYHDDLPGPRRNKE